MNKILKLNKQEDWSHCPGEENPAEIGSRGVPAFRLRESELWWKGPKWLSSPKYNWPVVEEIVDTDESLREVKKIIVMEALMIEAPSEESVIDIKAYSKFNKLVKVTAWVERFIKNLKARLAGNVAELGSLKMEEITSAESYLIKIAHKELRSRSDYQQLVSQLGLVERDGLVRCNGRLCNSDFKNEAREPIILPKNVG